MWKGAGFFLLVSGMSILAYVVFLASNADSSDNDTGHITDAADSPRALTEVPLLRDRILTQTERNGRYSYNVHYPEIAIAGTPLLVQGGNALFERTVRDMIDTFVSDRDLATTTNATHMLLVRWSPLLVSPSILSLRFDIAQTDTDSVRPNSRVRILNYNIPKHTLMSSEDIFASSTEAFVFLSGYTEKYLLEKSEATSSDPAMELIKNGTKPNPENFREIGITGNGVVVFFNPMQVGPYSKGVVSVPLPFSDLQGLVLPKIIEEAQLAETNMSEAKPENVLTNQE